MQACACTPRDEKGTLSLAGTHSPLEGESQKPSRQAPAEAVGAGSVAPLAPSSSPLPISRLMQEIRRGCYKVIFVSKALDPRPRSESRAGSRKDDKSEG